MRRIPRGGMPAGPVIVAALFLCPPAGAPAAPPANDTCAAAQELPLGTVLVGDTTEAANDYLGNMGSVPGSRVPSAGPDVVYRVGVPANTVREVTVIAPFRVSVYAVNMATPIPPCGQIGVWSSPFGTARLETGGTPANFQLVVDGWTPADRGSFEIAVSASADQAFFGFLQAVGRTIASSVAMGIARLATKAQVGALNRKLNRVLKQNRALQKQNRRIIRQNRAILGRL